MSSSLTHAKVTNVSSVDRPPTPPSPTPLQRPMKDTDIVDNLVLKKDSVFSTLPPAPKNATVVPAERRPWPSHSATRAHLPAHADIQVQRPHASPPKHRHVPARLSIMPRSSSGLVISTPTSMVSLTALLDDMPTPGNLSLAAELEQAEANAQQEDDEEEAQVISIPPKEKPLRRIIKEDDNGAKDVPPPYTQNASSSIPVTPAAAATTPATARPIAPAPGPVPVVAPSPIPAVPSVLGPAAPIISSFNPNATNVTPIPLSVLSARRPSTPMGRLLGATGPTGGSNLNLSAFGITASEPASPFSPGFNELGSSNNGFSRDPMGPLAFLANSQRTLALELVSMSMSDDLVALAETNSEIDRLKVQLAAKEAEAEAQRARIRGYQSALDRALIALQEEKNQLIAMRERLFVSGLQQKDDLARGHQSAHMALHKARSGWCRLWIDC